MKIIKKENGSILLETDSGEVRTLSKFAVLEAENDNEITVKQGQGQWDSIFLSGLQTQIEPAGAINFTGDVNDLIVFLSENFFFDVSGGGGGASPIYLGEFNQQPSGTPTELSYFYDTFLQKFFYSDLFRGKWLSFETITQTCGSSTNLPAGTYFRVEGVAMSPPISGMGVGFNCCLVSYSFNRQNTTASNIWVYDGTTIPPISGQGLIFPTTGFFGQDNNTNVDFGGGVIVARNATTLYGGGLVSQPILHLRFKYRYDFI